MEAESNTATVDSFMYHSTKSPPFKFSDYTHRVVVATMCLVVSFLGIVGNSLVILAVLLSKKVRTTTNAFVVNLSTTDLLTCLVIPLNAAVMLSKAGLPFGEWVCGVVTIVHNTAIGCSILTLTLIGLNRLLLITRPTNTYRVVYTPKKIVVWLANTWLLSLLLTVLPEILNVGGVGYNPKYHHYCASITSHPDSKVYRIILAGVIYPILLITIIVCYATIWRHLRRHSVQMTKASAPVGEASANFTLKETNFTGAAESERRQPSVPAARVGPSSLTSQQSKITKNMFYVVCAFMLCITPHALCTMFFDDTLAHPYTYALLLFNSCVNPLIYGTKHQDFKNIFGCIFRRQWDKIPEPSDFLKTMRGRKCCGLRSA